MLWRLCGLPDGRPKTLDTLILAEWTAIPLAAPQPFRHCASCGQPRAFASSGRVRLNANGKRLDAWLIYKCTHCDHTWNRPLLERQHVGRVDVSALDAMQQSAADWVRPHEFDVAGLKAHCARILHPEDCQIVKSVPSGITQDWSEIRLRLTSDLPTGTRLDRLICEGWGLSRSHLQRMIRGGQFTIQAETRNALKRPLHGLVLLTVQASGLDRATRAKLLEGLMG